MVRLHGHRQTKGAATDKPDLPPPRHISTLPTPDLQTRDFQQIVVNRVPGQTIIGSIVVTSTSGGDVVIDDFIFVIA